MTKTQRHALSIIKNKHFFNILSLSLKLASKLRQKPLLKICSFKTDPNMFKLT